MTISFELPHEIEQRIRRTERTSMARRGKRSLSSCTVRTQSLTGSSAEHSAWTAMTPTECSRSTVSTWKSPPRNFGPKLRHSEM